MEERKSETGEVSVTLSKKLILEKLQAAWHRVNSQGLSTETDEREAGMKAWAIEDFLLDIGALTKDDLKGVFTWGWIRR